MRTRTPADIREALENQKAAIRDSCAGFDAGKKWEALRLATAVYVLVHDGGKRNRSLLTQIGAMPGLKFICTGHPIEMTNLVSSNPLAIIRMNSTEGSGYRARLDENPVHHRWAGFTEWWDTDKIFSSGSGKNLVSRKNLVFYLRNKDGGSHYDESVEGPEYLSMAYGEHWIMVSSGKPPAALQDLALVSMRQVAHELLRSLERAGL